MFIPRYLQESKSIWWKKSLGWAEDWKWTNSRCWWLLKSEKKRKCISSLSRFQYRISNLEMVMSGDTIWPTFRPSFDWRFSGLRIQRRWVRTLRSIGRRPNTDPIQVAVNYKRVAYGWRLPSCRGVRRREERAGCPFLVRCRFSCWTGKSWWRKHLSSWINC